MTLKRLTVFALCAGVASPLAANDNTLFVLQDSMASAEIGNTLFVDQGLAVSSVVAGNQAGTDPAQQIGGANEADISLIGVGQTALLRQGTAENPAFGNVATMQVNGLNTLGAISQMGTLNTATLSVGGAFNTGAIVQNGSGNLADLTVTGVGTTGTLTQIGDNNDTTLTVDGIGVNVQYELIGNNQTTVLPPFVRSNAQSVSIRQIGGN